MKNIPLVFSVLLLILVLSGGGILLMSHQQLNSLAQATSDLALDAESGEYVNIEGDTLYPEQMAGNARLGQQVYRDLGCQYCHTQQVRRKGYGSDFERNYGARQMVSRDYVTQKQVFVGTMRMGPDLSNVGGRLSDEAWHYRHLFDPQVESKGSNMPAYKSLFTKRLSNPAQRSKEALDLKEGVDIELGYEVLPTQRAKDLVAYLLSLKLDYELPEAKFSE